MLVIGSLRGGYITGSVMESAKSFPPVLWKIRNQYPELDGQYVPFQEAKDEINA